MSSTFRVLVLLCLLTVSQSIGSLPVHAASTGASMNDSVDMGQPAAVGDFEFTVTNIDDDARDAVLAEDDENAEPGEGLTFTMVSMDATNIGAEAASPAYAFAFRLVGASGHGAMSRYLGCGTIPNDGFAIEAVDPGDSVSFTMCWVVPDQDPGTQILYVEPVLGGDGAVWYSLGNEPPTFTVPAVPDDVVSANSQADPVAVGSAGQTGAYLVTVTGANRDATSQVIEMDAWNEEPANGNRFVLMTVTTTYFGEHMGNPVMDLSFVGVGQDGTEYSTVADYCGVVVNDEMSAGQLFPGGSVASNLCWQVPAEEADMFLLRVTSYGDPGGEPVWFSLR
jgi:hypothetical protein